VVRTCLDYGESVTETSKSALIELVTTLKAYTDSLVLIGGWVPYFLIEKYKPAIAEFRHVGSIDIDFAVNPETITPDAYRTIVELINERDYRSKDGSQFSFEKDVPSPRGEGTHKIQVDFLTPAPNTQEKPHRHRKVQADLPARTLKGCEVVFRHNMDYELSGVLPRNGRTAVKFKMADIVGSLATKGIALGDRYKEKDAYDIYSLVTYCKNDSFDAADKVRQFASEPEVSESLEAIKARFKDIRAEGPSWVAQFMYPESERETKERGMADAYMRVNKFIEDVKKPHN